MAVWWLAKATRVVSTRYSAGPSVSLEHIGAGAQHPSVGRTEAPVRLMCLKPQDGLWGAGQGGS